MADLNALKNTVDINTYVELANKAKNLVNPETFYNKQLLDTIRIDASEYCYYGLADTLPIEGKADKFTIRRWAPLQAHTVPLVEGIPPQSDKGSVERFELAAFQYGRYMEFSDLVDLKVVDPVIAHYTKEYSIVAIETLDLLAREALFMVANPFYAGGAATFEEMKIPTEADAGALPNMTDLRQITLAFKRTLVKPRTNGKYLVTCSAEFTYDMVDDATVQKYMSINQTTKEMYDGSVLFPLFGLSFRETLVCPAHGEYYKMVNGAPKLYKRLVNSVNGVLKYVSVSEDTYLVGTSGDKVCSSYDGYVKDHRTGRDASYIPGQKIWDLANLAIKEEGGTGNVLTGWEELKVHHILIVGKDALARTGMSGEGSARMYVKPKGSAGVLDPIDQRQSIGFKINSVGFGSIRTEAVVDYMCIPTQANFVPDIITEDIGFVGPDEPEYAPASNQRNQLLTTVGKLADEIAAAAADFYEMTLASAAGAAAGETTLTPEIAAGSGQSYFVAFSDEDIPVYTAGTVLPATLQATYTASLADLDAGGLANVALFIVDDITSVIVHAGYDTVVAHA